VEEWIACQIEASRESEITPGRAGGFIV
jgi:hypothetical protein